jgi:hypothetical protein
MMVVALELLEKEVEMMPASHVIQAWDCVGLINWRSNPSID